MARHNLFEKLTLYPGLLNENAALPVFYADYSNSCVSNQVELMLSIDELNAYDSTYSNMISAVDSNLVILIDSLNVLYSLTYSPETAAAIASVIVQLHNLQLSSNNLMTQLNAVRQNNIQDILLKNDIIIPEELPEINEQLINEIYLSTVVHGNTNFTQEQINLIGNIANQCPFAGGPAVYRARVMNQLIDPDAVYDDDQTCLAQGFYRAANESSVMKVKLNIYPNPVRETFTISFESNEEQEMNLEISNMYGQKVQNIKLPTHQNSIAVSASNLSSGVYGLRLFKGKEIMGYTRINIVK